MPAGDIDLSLLPEGLQHRAPLVARFAEADDVDREELLASASESELLELSGAPAEHWDAVNATGARRALAGRARGSIRARGSLSWAIRYR